MSTLNIISYSEIVSIVVVCSHVYSCQVFNIGQVSCMCAGYFTAPLNPPPPFDFVKGGGIGPHLESMTIIFRFHMLIFFQQCQTSVGGLYQISSLYYHANHHLDNFEGSSLYNLIIQTLYIRIANGHLVRRCLANICRVHVHGWYVVPQLDIMFTNSYFEMKIILSIYGIIQDLQLSYAWCPDQPTFLLLGNFTYF